jgi:hypothetical protein
MRYASLLLVCVLSAGIASASDETQKLLDGRRVDDVLQFSVTRGKDAATVAYRVDGSSPGVLHDGDTFVAPATIDLTYKNFNPFGISITSTETAAPDPNQKAVADFLDALTGFAKTIAPPSEKAGGVGTRAVSSAAGDELNCMTEFKNCSKTVEADVAFAVAKDPKTDQKKLTEELLAKRCHAELEECVRCGGFNRAVRSATTVATASATPMVTADDLARWVRDANGRAGILSVRGFIPAGGTDFPPGTVARKQKDVQGVIDDLTKAKEQLASLSSAQDTCSTSVGTLSKLFVAAANLDEVIAMNKRLLASLDGIIKMLDDYAGRTWREGDAADSDLVFRQVESDPAQVKTIGLTFRLQKYTIDKDANSISGANDVEATRSLVLRRWRRLVPEVGVAAVYNDLQYPKYAAAKNDAGQLVVKKTTDSSNVNAAITMNLLCNCFGGSFLYPGIQLGVSQAKDYPGILGGIVFRFAQPKQLSLAIGRMITWYKDIDNTLQPDGPVASDADLQAHLKRRRAPTALYLAAQYNF